MLCFAPWRLSPKGLFPGGKIGLPFRRTFWLAVPCLLPFSHKRKREQAKTGPTYMTLRRVYPREADFISRVS